MFLAMLAHDVCQIYYTHQPPKRGCHLQLHVLTRCEARLPYLPFIVGAIFGCPKGPLGWDRIRCNDLSRRARMAVAF
jgi:hypothetical protein